MSKTIDVDTKTFIRFWVVILGFALVGLFIWQAWTGILIVLTAMFFAIALKPLARRIDNIDKSKERKSFSSISAVVLVVLAITAVIAFVGPMIVNESVKFFSNAPEQINTFLESEGVQKFGESIGIKDLRGEIVTTVKTFSQDFTSNISKFTLSSIGTIGSVLAAVVLIIVLTILFMLQGPELMEKIWNLADGKDKESSKAWRRTIDRMADVISKYVSGQLIVALLDGLVVGCSVLLLSLGFGFDSGLAIPMGLIAAFFYLIPMFGPIITAAIVTLLLIPSSLWAGIVFIVFYIIYAQFENNLISPRIQGKGLALPPLLILVSVTIGVYSFGLLGCVIAIPVAGCVKVLIEEYPALKRAKEEK